MSLWAPGKPPLMANLRHQLHAEDVVSVCLAQRLQTVYGVQRVQNRLGKLEGSFLAFPRRGCRSGAAGPLRRFPRGGETSRLLQFGLFPRPLFQGEFSLNVSHHLFQVPGDSQKINPTPPSHSCPQCSQRQHGDCTKKHTWSATGVIRPYGHSPNFTSATKEILVHLQRVHNLPLWNFHCMLKPKELLLRILYYPPPHRKPLTKQTTSCKCQIWELLASLKFSLLLHMHYITIFNYLISYFLHETLSHLMPQISDFNYPKNYSRPCFPLTAQSGIPCLSSHAPVKPFSPDRQFLPELFYGAHHRSIWELSKH